MEKKANKAKLDNFQILRKSAESIKPLIKLADFLEIFKLFEKFTESQLLS